MRNVSILIPARNEAQSLRILLPQLQRTHSTADIILVDDGSTDDTAEVATRLGIKVIRHPYGMGNGAAIKTAARAASGDIFVFLDADGQHCAAEILRLLEELDKGYDMVIGARTFSNQASVGRGIANTIYNRLASWMVGHRVSDLTSGFRAVRADKFRKFLYLLPNGFSYPTTITMAFFRVGYTVQYVPIQVAKRIGKSHIRPIRDSVRFFLIIFRVGTLYSPLKLFFPISLIHFFVGLGYYLYTYSMYARFSNMSMLLFTAAVIVFLIGLVSEQITNLLYSKSD